MSHNNQFYPLLAKRQAAVKEKTIDAPLRQKLLLALPDIRQRFLNDNKVILTAQVNHIDNFSLHWRKVIVNEMMQVVIDGLSETPCLDANEKWWNSGFPKRENTSCWGRDHQEIEKLAEEMTKSVYYEIKGRQTKTYATDV